MARALHSALAVALFGLVLTKVSGMMFPSDSEWDSSDLEDEEDAPQKNVGVIHEKSGEHTVQAHEDAAGNKKEEAIQEVLDGKGTTRGGKSDDYVCCEYRFDAPGKVHDPRRERPKQELVVGVLWVSIPVGWSASSVCHKSIARINWFPCGSQYPFNDYGTIGVKGVSGATRGEEAGTWSSEHCSESTPRGSIPDPDLAPSGPLAPPGVPPQFVDLEGTVTMYGGYGNILHDGDTYTGGWKDGYFHGHGIQTSATGYTIEGAFRRGVPHGRATYTRLGQTYTGDWVSGKFHGVGTWTWENGDIYTGGFKNGKRDGHGIYTFANGKTREVVSKEGKFVP